MGIRFGISALTGHLLPLLLRLALPVDTVDLEGDREKHFVSVTLLVY